MNKSILIATSLAALIFIGCEKADSNANTNSGETPLIVDVTPDEPVIPTQAELTASIANADINDKAQILSDARALVENYGIRVAQDLSNAMWSGNDGYERNRTASAAIAVAAYEDTPQIWSTLRSGIAYTNGLGAEQDASKAISILSSDLVVDNSAAQYFLAKAYELNGQDDLYRVQLQKAANMGHTRAKAELEG